MAHGNNGMKIRHTMIRVADLQRSVDFYTQHLGMDLMRQRESEVRGERVAYVGYGDEDSNHALEIVEMMEPPAEYVHGNTYGHVALLVTNVQEKSDRLKNAGVEFAHEPHQTRPDNPNMIAFIKDPDGYEIELTERR
ncbi:MAG: lactoylglutathione lyase [Alphaproteobacteria bacterium]|nr:lactoylglutathione lyase [Alphaproteobacteria bacterium]